VRGRASAPGSSGNLGPGFDTLALALELRCVVEAEPAEATVVVHDDGEEWCPGDDEIVARAVAAVGPPMRLWIRSEIPRRRGLGSSSAVAVATVAAALRARSAPVDPEEVFRVVAELEGHGDNAAASVFGGLQAACVGTARRLELHPELIPIVAIPDFELATGEAREALPAEVRHAAAARSVARAVFLVEGLRHADAGALRCARGDELHERPRSGLSPLTTRLVEVALEAGALHAAWSGAGPSALALVREGAAAEVAAAMGRVLGPAGEVRRLAVAAEGLT